MSFMKTLQSIGILEKDSQPAKQSQTEEAARLTVADVRGIGEPQPTGFSDEQVEAHLEQSINANPDFAPAAKFLEQLTAIQGVIAEEGLRFRTAQATSKVDTGALITALQAHDATLQYEARQFEQAVVDSRTNQINTLVAQAGQLQSQIEELQKQIADLATQKDQVSAEVITQQDDLNRARHGFRATATKVGQRYTDLAKKVSAYLGAANG